MTDRSRLIPAPMVKSVSDAVIIPELKIDVFPIQPETQLTIEMTRADRRVSASQWTIREGGIEGAISFFKDNISPHLLIIESNDEPDVLIGSLDRLAAECGSQTRVIVLSARNDVNFFRRLLGSGVTDEITTPFRPMDLIDAIARAWEDGSELRLGRLIAFIGARGGAGSSTVAHNVAAVIANGFDTSVLLADLDLQFGTVGIDFDVEGSYGMNDVLRSAERLDDVLLDRIVLKYDQNLQLLASEPTLERVPDLHGGALEKLIALARTTPRHVLLDIPRVWTSRTKRALMHADQIVITAAPDLTSLRNTKLIADFLRQSRPNDLTPILVLNQVGQPRRPEISPAEFFETVRLQDGHVIPFNASLFGKAANQGQVVAYQAGKSKVNQRFHGIGKRIVFPDGRDVEQSLQQKINRFIRRWW